METRNKICKFSIFEFTSKSFLYSLGNKYPIRWVFHTGVPFENFFESLNHEFYYIFGKLSAVFNKFGFSLLFRSNILFLQPEIFVCLSI